jgi:hypothetical protein
VWSIQYRERVRQEEEILQQKAKEEQVRFLKLQQEIEEMERQEQARIEEERLYLLECMVCLVSGGYIERRREFFFSKSVQREQRKIKRKESGRKEKIEEQKGRR